MLTKQEKTGRVTTLNELVHNLMSAFILEILCFILLPFKARHAVFISITSANRTWRFNTAIIKAHNPETVQSFSYPNNRVML